MNRHDIIDRIGRDYLTSNIEGGEYSYVQEAGNKNNLKTKLGRNPNHYKLDIRFEDGDYVVLVETKQHFTSADEDQLKDYADEERALHPDKKIIAMLANTNNNDIKVWKQDIKPECELSNETVLDTFAHYKKLFNLNFQNDREKVLKNTYNLNELLHKMDIDESKRSQFVGTSLLYIKDLVKKMGAVKVDEELKDKANDIWKLMNPKAIRAAIESTLNELLDGSRNKAKKIELLQKNVLNDQKVKNLSTENWIVILDTILMDIYRYIDADSSEGQDILNLFFIAFNKYTGKADKNQAFTPDHITDFMCRVVDVDKTKVVMDICCGSGSFLVQAMVKEIADARNGATEQQAESLIKDIKLSHIYGIENEEKAYGLSTTNMLIHSDGNSNIEFKSCFDCKSFIKNADPDIFLMNPPYNAKPIGIPQEYKKDWGKAKDGKEDPSKGFVFVKYLSDIIKEINEERAQNNQPRKTAKLAVLLPVAAAIGTSSIIEDTKIEMLKDNTLDAVFTLPNEVFYPGASASVCCMVFTLGKPHINSDGTTNKTFFGYYKDDAHKKKKNLGRIELFDADNNSLWKKTEEKWLEIYRNKTVEDGLSAMNVVTGKDEWLCEAYMKTDYSKLTEADFQQTLNNYLAYLMKEGKIHES